MTHVHINGKAVTLTEARKILKLKELQCLGCVLGDASPKVHDYGFGCAYGKGA